MILKSLLMIVDFQLFLINSVNSQTFVRAKQLKNSGKNPETYWSLASDGAWCWFSDPRAVKFKGSKDNTYAGYIDSHGNVTIACYDNITGKTETKILYENLQVDDHDNPSILIGPGGYLYVFFNRHGGPNPLYFMKSLKPEDISKWTDVRRLELNDKSFYPEFNDTYTYTNPVMLSEENNRIYIFWRGIDNKPNYSYSDDLGETWSKGRIFILPERIYNMRRPYLKVYSDGKSKIHFAFTDGHPNVEKENSIYYMYYSKESFYRSNGQKIREMGNTPVQPRETDVVYDATITAEKAWIWDVAQDKHGNPVLVYAKFPTDSVHIYCYSRWNGSKWETSDLLNSGKWFPQTLPGKEETEKNYSGGMNIDKENTNIIYMSVNRGGVFEIEKWQSRSNGRRWIAEAVTRGSSKDNVRPFAVRNATENDPFELLWLSNTFYIHYNRRSDDLSGYRSSVKTNMDDPRNPEKPE